MINRARLLLAVGTLLAATSAPAQEDIRERFGTRSYAAAAAIRDAIAAAERHQYADAIGPIETALKIEPDAQLAWLWKGIVMSELGRTEPALEALEKATCTGEPLSGDVAIAAAFMLGKINGRSKRWDESTYWFSWIILVDPEDAAKQAGDAYYHLGVTLNMQGRHLSAAMAMLQAHLADPKKVKEKTVEDFMRRAGEFEETALVLRLDRSGKGHKPAPRKAATRLTKVELAGEAPKGKLRELLADPRGRFLIAVAAGAKAYWVVRPGPEARIEKISLPRALRAACLAEGRLFATVAGPEELIELAPETGKVVRSWRLDDRATGSVAVLPARQAAFFCYKKSIHRLDLRTGKIADTELPGEIVRAHPRQRCVFAGHTTVGPTPRHYRREVVKGKKVYLEETIRYVRNQTTLLKAVILGRKLAPAELREYAAKVARDLTVSPDGRWVALPGRAGWQPLEKGKGGNVVPVFSVADLSRVAAVVKTNGPPVQVAFNPVTNQIAVLSKDLRIVHPAETEAKPHVEAGAFGPPCAWSGDGRHLVVSEGSKGLAVFRNALTSAEEARAESWPDSAGPAPPFGLRTKTPPRPPAKAIREVAAFKPSSDPAVVRAAVRKAIASKRTDRLAGWDTGPHRGTEATRRAYTILARQKGPPDLGVKMYQLSRALKDHPGSAVLLFFLAEAQLASKLYAKAGPNFLAAVRADAGRTRITVESLNRLPPCYREQGRTQEALHCLALSLWLDRADPKSNRLLAASLERAGMKAQAAEVRSYLRSLKGLPSQLPKLAAPPAGALEMPANKVYPAAASSIVLVQKGRTFGSGVCIGSPNLIVTDKDLLKETGQVRVHAFKITAEGKVRFLPYSGATMPVESADLGLVVLRLKKELPSLRPLTVAAASPAAGEKVFAVGSPPPPVAASTSKPFGEGIVSGPPRRVDGRRYLQHTAAVGPVSAGGALLDSRGHLVGINVLSVKLEGVRFAVPVEEIRSLFTGDQ